MMNSELITIGLFGTCGNSTWRNQFINDYERLGISYFNPQVSDGTWTPGCVHEENKHLMEDAVILFPVLKETTGQGSLAEIGFSINAAINRNPDRYFIFLIESECTDTNATEAQRADSVRTRVLVRSKLVTESKKNSGIYIVENLDEMLLLSVNLHGIVSSFRNLRNVYMK